MTRKRITTRKNAETQATPVYDNTERSFHELTKLFLTAKKVDGNAPRSLKDFAYNFQLFERWLTKEGLQELKPTDWNVSTFRSYVSYMTDKYSASTVNTRITALKTLFKFLVGSE